MNAAPSMSEPSETFSGPSAGALLRQAREAAGLHIGALAVSLKVPVKKIEALEADRVDLLPDTVFARALAASICRTLKVDAGPVLARLPQGLMPRLKTDESSLNTAYQGPGFAAQSTLAQRLSKPFVVIGMVLVAAAAFLLVVPLNIDGVKNETVPEKTSEAGVLPAVAANAQPVTVANVASENAVSPTPTPDKAPEKMGPAVAAALPPDAKALGSGPETVGAGADGIVVFSAKGSAWIEVTDAAGVVQLRKTLSSGETAGASGPSPLKVVVGRVDSVSLKVRGKDFDLAAVTRDNVARFEVK